MNGNQLASVSLRAGIAALVLLIVALGAGLSIVGLVAFLVAAVLAIGAIVTGHIARVRSHRTQGTGSRQAAIGLTLGYALLLVMVIGIALLFSVRLPY
jgi:archaellin